jgi:dTDP-4-amino-4,6-dideoxygalactose transaminase
VPDTIRHHSSKVIFEEYVEPAYNYRMTDLQAAIGRPQIARLDAVIAERRRLADRYVTALADNPMFEAPRERPGLRSNWQSYPLRLRAGTGRSQIEILQALVDRGITAKRGIMNAHQATAYAGRGTFGCVPGGLPISEKLRDESVVIPLFHGMTVEEQSAVIGALDAVAK